MSSNLPYDDIPVGPGTRGRNGIPPSRSPAPFAEYSKNAMAQPVQSARMGHQGPPPTRTEPAGVPPLGKMEVAPPKEGMREDGKGDGEDGAGCCKCVIM
jgi:hypothetical protein